MKHIVIFILGIALSLMLVVVSITTSLGILYFSLSEFKNTFVMEFFPSFINDTFMFWSTLISVILYIIISLLQRICTKNWFSHIKNFIVLFCAWLTAGIVIIFALFTFALTDPLSSQIIVINLPRKIGLGTLAIFIVVYHIFAKKISLKINRRLQSHDVAKEIGAVGRSSIIWNNILRTFEFFFPELLALIALCLVTSLNISCYFIACLAASLFPFIANIECDYNIRNEANRREQEKHNKLVSDIANQIT